MIVAEYNMPVLISGSAKEIALAETVSNGIGEQAICVAGVFAIGEFICLINHARGLVRFTSQQRLKRQQWFYTH
jgi:hypothetical protein